MIFSPGDILTRTFPDADVGRKYFCLVDKIENEDIYAWFVIDSNPNWLQLLYKAQISQIAGITPGGVCIIEDVYYTSYPCTDEEKFEFYTKDIFVDDVN